MRSTPPGETSQHAVRFVDWVEARRAARNSARALRSIVSALARTEREISLIQGWKLRREPDEDDDGEDAGALAVRWRWTVEAELRDGVR
jgi:hypothetical protein